MDVKLLADLAHDDLVDLCFSMGYFSEDKEINRQFFQAVHLIIWRKLEEVARKQQEKDVRDLADLLACERARWMQKIQKVSLS